MKIFVLFLMTINVFALNFDKQLQTINSKIDNINTAQLQKILATNSDAILIDVRTEKEIEFTGTINRGQNINIPRGWLEFRAIDYAKDAKIITYCGKNSRSPLAAKKLMDMGFTNVVNYADGYFKWQKAGLATTSADNYPESFLYNKVIKVKENIYSAIGATQPSTYQNSGHNNNLSFIVGDKEVLVFNAGGSYLLAKSLHDEIKKITTKPVKYVVLENAQGHAMLGSNYWQEQGAIIISHKLTKDEIAKHGLDVLARATKSLKDKIHGTKIITPNQTFTDTFTINLGNFDIKLMHLGISHSPDDIQLWIAKDKFLISGDSAFNERMLPILEHTDMLGWIKTWDKLEKLNPSIIIPGHGRPTNLKTITKFTKNYLQYMTNAIIKILGNDGSLSDAYNIDQSRFRDWGTYRELHLRNSARIFQKMEFEY